MYVYAYIYVNMYVCMYVCLYHKVHSCTGPDLYLHTDAYLLAYRVSYTCMHFTHIHTSYTEAHNTRTSKYSTHIRFVS